MINTSNKVKGSAKNETRNNLYLSSAWLTLISSISFPRLLWLKTTMERVLVCTTLCSSLESIGTWVMGEDVLAKAGKGVYVGICRDMWEYVGICINLICVCWDESWVVVAVVVLLLLLLAKLAGMNLRIIFS